MQDGNNKTNAQKDFDEIITMACLKNFDEYDCDRAIADEERIAEGLKVPSDDIMEQIMARRRAPEHNDSLPEKKETKTNNVIIYKFKPKKGLIIVALIAAALFGALSATALNEFVFDNDTVNVEDSMHTSMRTTNFTEEEKRINESYSEAEEKMGVILLRPGYVPEGMSFEHIRSSADRARITYRTEEGDATIQFVQQIVKTEKVYGNIVNATEPSVEMEKIAGWEIAVTSFEQDDTGELWVKATWNEEIKNSNDMMTYSINTNISEEELVKFIENLK